MDRWFGFFDSDLIKCGTNQLPSSHSNSLEFDLLVIRSAQIPGKSTSVSLEL